MPRARTRAAARAGVDAAQAAWLTAIPVAALALAAIVVLGPPLGHALPTPRLRFWQYVLPWVRPEPTEQARYLIALTAPLLLAAATLALTRRAPAAVARAAAVGAAAVEAGAAVFLVVCFVVQRTHVGQDAALTRPFPYFSLAALAAAVAIGGGIALLAHREDVRRRCAGWFAESPARRRLVLAVVAVAIAVTLLPAINTDASVERAHEQVSFHLQFIYDEAAAVLDGRSPLGDFTTQYASLLPYGFAAVMALFGTSVLLFTCMLAALTASGLGAIFAVLRRVTRSSVAAALLFLPVLAASAHRLRGEAVNRFSLINYFGVTPLRYAGPFLLAWLVVRRLDGARDRRVWPLFLAAGLVAVNNPDFGLPAFAATVVALVAGRATSRTGLRRAALEALAGSAAALALVTALLLVRTGAPPRFGLLFGYASLFTRAGFGMFRIKPQIGLSTVMYLTFAGAIGVAAVSAFRGGAERALAGALAWSGVFGLGAGAYYVARSRSEQLYYVFPAWAFALALLTVVAIRWLAATGRRPTPSVLACLIGFGLLAGTLVQTPLPWQQVQRIARHGAPIYAQPQGEAFVAQHARRGERVLILTTLGHKIAHDLGLQDVERYTGMRSIQTAEQLEDSLRALRAAGGRALFLWWPELPPDALPILERGYRPAVREPGGDVQLWVARRRA